MSFLDKLFGKKESTIHALGTREPAQKSAGKTAVRILIAHTGDVLASQDVNEILKYAWDGQISKNVKVTSHPLTPTGWISDEQFTVAWTIWQQMLQHKYGEHPYWEDHKTHAYRGTIVRTQQRFYIEIYYKDFQETGEPVQKVAESTVIKNSEKQLFPQTTNAGLQVVKCSKCGRTLTQHEPDVFSATIGDTWLGTICPS